MFSVNGYTINLSRGDTGSIRIVTQTEYTFSENDRVLFSMKNSAGEVVRQQAFPLDENKSFLVNFSNADTDSLPTGAFSWDLRYIINPYYDDQGNIIDGDQVITPKAPMTFQLMPVVGEV